MALPPLTSSDVGAAARSKINAGFAATDANTAAIAAEATARSTADGTLGRRIDDAFDALNAFAQATGERLHAIFNALDNAATQDAVAAALAIALRSALTNIFQAGRPGLAPEAFSTAAVGLIASAAPLDPAGAIFMPFGAAYKIAGAGLIAPRASVPVDPDTITVLRLGYSRTTDVIDPNNNAIDIGLQWLDRAGADAGTTLLFREPNLRVQDGPRLLTFRVPSLRDTRPVIAPPGTAASWRPFLRTYGGDGATAVSILDTRDATFAGAYVPDVSDLADRLGRIEGLIEAGMPLATPILPTYAVADLPRPGTRGRKAFASDGRAPNAAGTLEAANAGTGVEVTDNGVKWVVAGTNQQVQS